MGDGQAAAGKVARKRSFSIEKHLKRGEDGELAFDLGAAAETGGIRLLVQEIRALRADMAEVKHSLSEGAAKAGPSAQPELDPGRHPGASEGIEGDEAQILRIEVARMVRSLATAKREIAEIKHPLREPDDDRMTKAASELDEIVSATEDATNSILDSSEAITAHCAAILSEIGDMDTIAPRLHDVNDHVARIMEACNFQDITGQRISKVVRTLEFIEDRIKTIVEDWGRDAFLDLPLPDDDAPLDEGDESHLLNGPQLQNKGLSQGDIDSLFD
ncbi:protein phosphatase CheZ [Rhodospira trueperi]|uniref:Chemotaxis protein CheZ n=1 Tax=Rhodospira trueperi TaxID=69960 RepID=A0A1G7E494_9PROT|nr:protein phosphatase CheZ [Rhodospira trueperi]SDE58286.1 chemotaxis protein CheZ [Rhodospira trueperi]